MNIEVTINGHLIHREPVNYKCAQDVAERLRKFYGLDLLNAVKIKSEICISGVGSMMNSPEFTVKQEWYDRIIEDDRHRMAV